MDSNKKGNKFEIDIEIKDFLWEFARRWRLIVVLAVICGIALAAYQYRIDMNKTDVVTVKKTQEELESSMGKQDLDEVTAAVALKRQADERSAYMESSELMKINPYEENAVFLQYYISADPDVAAAAYEAYVAYVEQGAFKTELVSVERSSDTTYINAKSASDRAALTVTGGTGEHVFCVKVIGVSADGALALAREVKTVLREYRDTVAANIGEHQLQLINETSAVIADQELAELQNWNATSIKVISNNLDSMKNEMTGDQITLYTYRTTVTIDTVTPTAAPVVEKTVTISVKHALIGAIVGIILACGVIFVSYLFAAALRSGEEVKTLYHVNVIGTVDDSQFRKKRLFGFVDTLILKGQNFRKKKLTYDQELQMIAANIALDCKKNDKMEVFLTSSAMEILPDKIVKDIVSKCESKGIKVVKGAAIGYDAEALETSSKIGNVVFVEKKGISLYDELYKECALCKEHRIHVAGMIVIGA